MQHPQGWPFNVIALMGEGAAGAVFEVRLPGDDRRLVAKVLKNCSETSRERLRREGELVARLDAHPGIVRVVAADVLPDGVPYLLFELVEGNTLRDLLRHGPVPPARALEIATELADALEWAHRHGVVHRDVKPENVLLAGDRVRLADFGLALSSDLDRLTATRHVVGTPLYFAPEQLLDHAQEIGPPADVHALGLILWELLTGRSFFDGSHAELLMRSIRERRCEPLAGQVAGLDPAVDRILDRCLRKDPRERYSSAELVADLRRLGQGQPLAPAPGSRRALPVVLAVAALSLALALGATLRAVVTRGAPATEGGGAALLEQAEAALRAGDLLRARACLAGVATGSAPASQLETLRAGLLALDPPPSGGEGRIAAAVQALERALSAGPGRDHLREWLARLELRRGHAEAAAAALQGHPDPPPELGLRVALAARRLDQAEALAARVEDRALRGELAWARAAERLEQGDLARARASLAEAVRSAPDSPRREQVLERLRTGVVVAADWRPSGQAGSSGDDLARLRAEVDWRAALLLLDPGHRLPEDRREPLAKLAQTLATREKGRAREVCTALVDLAPEHDAFYIAYGTMALGDGFSRPDEEVPRLRKAMALTAGRRMYGLVAVGLAQALSAAGRLEEIGALVAEVEQEDPRSAAMVRSVQARALAEHGKPQEALRLADELAGNPMLGASNHFTRHVALREMGDPGGATGAAWDYLEGQNMMGAMWPGELERASSAVAWIASQAAPSEREQVRARALGEVLRARPDAVHLVASELCERPSPAMVDLLERALGGWRRMLSRPSEDQRLGSEQRAQLQASLDAHLRETVPRARALVEQGAAREELEELLQPFLQRPDGQESGGQ